MSDRRILPLLLSFLALGSARGDNYWLYRPKNMQQERLASSTVSLPYNEAWQASLSFLGELGAKYHVRDRESGIVMAVLTEISSVYPDGVTYAHLLLSPVDRRHTRVFVRLFFRGPSAKLGKGVLHSNGRFERDLFSSLGELANDKDPG